MRRRPDLAYRAARPLLAGIVLVAAMAFSAATVAFAGGELTQKPGTAGCIAPQGADGCAEARGPAGVGIAVSADGKSAYALGQGAILTFDRDPTTGALTQLPGKAGCVSGIGAEGCEKGRALEGLQALVVSPDGKSLYVAARASNAMAIFDRDPVTGVLTQKPEAAGCIGTGTGPLDNCQKVRAAKGVTGVAVSPDGNDVYVSAANTGSVAILDRDAAGALAQKQGKAGCISADGTGVPGGSPDECEKGRAFQEPHSVTVSPDGKSVYVSSGDAAIAIFDRGQNGGLAQKPGAAGCISEDGTAMSGGAPGECQDTTAFESPNRLAVSPDGKDVYVVAEGSSAVVTFDRAADGALTPMPGPAGCISKSGSEGACREGRGLGEPNEITVSPDGTNVYVAGGGSSALAIFDRGAGGALTQKEGAAGCVSESGTNGLCQKGRGLESVGGLALSPDGKNVYAGQAALAIFDRATTSSRDTVAPEVTAFRLAPARFKPGAKHGSHFRFGLSEPASARIAVERARPGRRVAGSCRKPSPKLAKRPRCTRFARLGALDLKGLSSGANSIAFRGKVGKHRLVPGSYRATIVATDAAGNSSAPVRAHFAILPARR